MFPMDDVALVGGVGPVREDVDVAAAVDLRGPAVTVTGNDVI